MPSLAAALQIAAPRLRPQSKLSDSCETDVSGVKALVVVGRFCQAALHPLDTDAKNR